MRLTKSSRLVTQKRARSEGKEKRRLRGAGLEDKDLAHSGCGGAAVTLLDRQTGDPGLIPESFPESCCECLLLWINHQLKTSLLYFIEVK